MRTFDVVEAIDETVASYRMAGVLVDITPFGNVIVAFTRSRQIELTPHQVDVTDPNPQAWI